jgi:transposase
MKNDYTGKTIFVGIDVHKKTYAVTAICDNEIVKRDTLKANPSVLIAYLKKRFGMGKILTAYESGFCGFHLHRALVAENIQNIVVHAASIEVSNDRVKTDKRDSLKIASHLSHGKLKGIHVPTVEREDFRALTRLRDTFCSEKTRLACQIKSLLHTQGLITADDDRKVSEKWIRNLSSYETTPGIKYAIEQLANMWLAFNFKIKDINEKLKSQAIEDKKIDEIYQSVPGIGPISARVLANELDNLQHFKNERQLFSYIGFTPTEHSSGEHTRQGHITRQGKPILRKILVQVAWMAIRRDKQLNIVFERIALKAGCKRAIVAIARILIGRIRACFRTGTFYKPHEVKIPEKQPPVEKTERVA